MNSATSSTPLATNTPRRAFMQRAAACTVALVAGVLAAPRVQAQPSYTVSLAQLHEAVAQKFPRSVPVQGLIDLTLQAPQLRVVPAANRLGALMAVRRGYSPFTAAVEIAGRRDLRIQSPLDR